MKQFRSFKRMLAGLCLVAVTSLSVAGQVKPGRDPQQPIDEEYTKKIREYTTEPFFSSPLVDYLLPRRPCRPQRPCG